ncbi:MAG TPA: FAD-dependent oxidoreductase [Candidatus Polarisedimenticolaceae bacterium]|nr:FAD-dependent oxidoreductase [Candidatus Polarisedimenticolaceae bacterium]
MTDVLVVGAGMMGASVAYHLARGGCRDVVVLDRGPRPGSGSTGRATGGFRAQFGTAIHVRLSLLSRSKLQLFHVETGGDAGYVPAGYLWLATRETDLTALRAARAVQLAEGLREAVEVTPREVASLNPAIRTEGVLGGTFCPTDGFLSPLGLLGGYVTAATRLGVRFLWGEHVRELHGSAAVTSTGRHTAGTLVNAAGPWAGALTHIPVVPLRRQVAVTVPTEVLAPTMPMTIFTDDGFHLRVRDGRVLLLRASPGAADPFDASVDPAWVTSVTAEAHTRVPALRNVPIDRASCWAGLYEMSPDRHALLGRAPGFSNLYLINGSSGHGVMHAPALGQLLAEIILEGKARTLDVRPLRPERFAEGEPNAGEML